MECSNMMNRGGRLNSSNMVNRGNIVDSSNVVNRGHRLHSSNAVNRADSLDHWSSISSVSSIIRISLPLGHMDSSSRVSHIATSSSIGSGSHYAGHSSRGCSSDRKGGRGGHLSISSMVVTMVQRRSIAVATISSIPSISQPLEPRVSQAISSIYCIASISSISTIPKDVRVSLSSCSRCKAENSQELVHVGQMQE